MKTTLRAFLAMLLLALLTACSKPVPEAQKDYVGLWEANEMRLLITADGTLDYKRVQGGGSTSINAPIQEFTASGFSAGLGPLKTEFKVGQAPHQVEGVWKMTVDGVELTRNDSGGFAGNTEKQ
ncbi:hypothetical protein [Arenimonas sp.]|uniref:hypothetical protein n=1 Tax=Arenimonas sp. TaxID=1872635 RepID=UPI0039E638DE